MCTLALAWHVLEDAPIAVAANRDEVVDRPAEPPGVYGENPLVIAPRDAEAGGTWIGFNEDGVFAGITNRWSADDLAGERSRGLLVADVLSAESTAEAVEYVERTTATYEYDGFYLVIADEEAAVCLEWDGALARTDFDPGVHVVVNVGFDDRFRTPSIRPDAARAQAENARSVREALAVEPGDSGEPDGSSESGRSVESSDEWLDRAGSVLGDHEYGVCVHGDGFGTRSSSLIAIGREPTYRFANGPPCRTSYEPLDLERHI